MASAVPTPARRADVIVVGGGAAGLFCALVAADAGARVTLVSRSPLDGSASFWAQGGIAAALAPEDSAELHARDTAAAGRGAARMSAVEVLCADSPGRVEQLAALGVAFDRDADGALALGLEGGHSARRIVHAGGSETGRRIAERLSALAAAHDRIEVIENALATALLTAEGRCVGIVARASDGSQLRVHAPSTVLATGGAAALWARTTNPAGSVGLGLVIAAQAGAELADLEFVQFHPTALVSDSERDGFLITEAVRGEGAVLVDGRGERFVDELAPRDEVALAIEQRLRDDGARSVGLDLQAVDLTHFPNIAAALAAEGIDPRREPVPVAPAAHYTMGGVATDLDGRASLPGLLAVGECACTGLHGANRLASNSLAECFVLGHRAALAALDRAASTADPAAATFAPLPDRPGMETRTALWRHAGLRREPAGLRALLDDPFELARMIGAACLAREESRGAHQRSDRPAADPALAGRHVLLTAAGETALRDWN